MMNNSFHKSNCNLFVNNSNPYHLVAYFTNFQSLFFLTYRSSLLECVTALWCVNLAGRNGIPQIPFWCGLIRVGYKKSERAGGGSNHVAGTHAHLLPVIQSNNSNYNQDPTMETFYRCDQGPQSVDFIKREIILVLAVGKGIQKTRVSLNQVEAL